MTRTGRLTLLSFVAAAFLAAPSLSHAAEQSVKVSIDVLSCSKKAGTVEPQLKKVPYIRKLIDQLNFRSVKRLDELSTNIKLNSTVTLQMPNKKHNLKVTLKKMSKDGSRHFKIAIPEMKFQSDTHHKKGAPFVVVLPSKSDQKTVLAVKPQN